jgi:acyl dehydratase
MKNPLFRTLYFEDLAIGMRATIRKTVENEDVIGFAELSGDHNPIHLSEHFARKTRFGGRIVHGLYTASLISGSSACGCQDRARSISLRPYASLARSKSETLST